MAFSDRTANRSINPANYFGPKEKVLCGESSY